MTSRGATRLGATRLGATRLGATRLGATRLGVTRLGATRLGVTRLGPAAAAAAVAVVPLLALLTAAPDAFTRLHPLRLAAASLAVLLVTLLAVVLRGRTKDSVSDAAKDAAGDAARDSVSDAAKDERRASAAAGPAWAQERPSPVAPVALVALLWIGWAGLSLFWSPNPGLGLLGLVALLMGMLWYGGLTALLGAGATSADPDRPGPARGRRRLSSLSGAASPASPASPLSPIHLALLLGLLVAGGALSILALAQRAGHLRLGLHEVGATLGNPNHLALALVALLPAALWLHGAARDGGLPWPPSSAAATLARGVALLYMGLVLFGLHATRCQAAWLALVAMGLFVLWTWPRWRLRRRLLAAASLAGLAFAIAAWALPRAPLWASLQGRVLVARVGLGVLSEAPLGGAGLGGFGSRVAWAQGELLAREPGAYAPLLDAHHQALMVAGETGLVGLGLAVLLLILLVRPIWARRREPLAQASLAAWVGLFVFSLSETALRDVGVWIVAVAWLALGRGPSVTLSREPGRPLAPGVDKCFVRIGASRALAAAWRGASKGALALCRTAALPVALLVAFLAVGDARADFHHARGLRALGRAGEGAERATFVEALACYDRALSTSLDSAALHFDRALALRALGRPKGAAAAARAAFAARPGPDRALLVGDLAAAAGDLVEAALWYQRAVDLHPRYARARNNLGVILRRVGQPEVGCASLRRALSLRPFEPTIRENWQTLCAPSRRSAGPPPHRPASPPRAPAGGGLGTPVGGGLGAPVGGGLGTPRTGHQLGKRLGTSSRVTQGAGMSSRA